MLCIKNHNIHKDYIKTGSNLFWLRFGSVFSRLCGAAVSSPRPVGVGLAGSAAGTSTTERLLDLRSRLMLLLLRLLNRRLLDRQLLWWWCGFNVCFFVTVLLLLLTLEARRQVRFRGLNFASAA
jgi:hypothetical protein